MRGDVIVLDTKSVRVNWLKSGFDFPQGPLGFFLQKPGYVRVEHFSVGESEGNIQIFVFNDFVFDQGGFESVFGVDLSELSKVFQS